VSNSSSRPTRCTGSRRGQTAPDGAIVSEFSTQSRDDLDVFTDPDIARTTVVTSNWVSAGGEGEDPAAAAHRWSHGVAILERSRRRRVDQSMQ
jgi:hypothetical protein